MRTFPSSILSHPLTSSLPAETKTVQESPTNPHLQRSPSFSHSNPHGGNHKDPPPRFHWTVTPTNDRRAEEIQLSWPSRAHVPISPHPASLPPHLLTSEPVPDSSLRHLTAEHNFRCTQTFNGSSLLHFSSRFSTVSPELLTWVLGCATALQRALLPGLLPTALRGSEGRGGRRQRRGR